MSKGIILAGGTGTRLYPLTVSVSKQLMPVYSSPMIYYPLCTLMSAGIRDILIITTPHDQAAFQRLLGNGYDFGITLEYAVQEEPKGIAQAMIIAEDFLAGESSVLILGDNLFHGQGFKEMLGELIFYSRNSAGIFGYSVEDPSAYGVVELDKHRLNVVSIEEKPEKPKSRYAIPGIYYFPNTASAVAKNLKPSFRGEIEITGLLGHYLVQKKINCIILPSGIAWLDTGTHDSLLDAANYVKIIEERQGIKVACPQEIAMHPNNQWLSRESVKEQIKLMGESSYAKYLTKLLDEA